MNVIKHLAELLIIDLLIIILYLLMRLVNATIYRPLFKKYH